MRLPSQGGDLRARTREGGTALAPGYKGLRAAPWPPRRPGRRSSAPTLPLWGRCARTSRRAAGLGCPAGAQCAPATCYHTAWAAAQPTARRPPHALALRARLDKPAPTAQAGATLAAPGSRHQAPGLEGRRQKRYLGQAMHGQQHPGGNARAPGEGPWPEYVAARRQRPVHRLEGMHRRVHPPSPGLRRPPSKRRANRPVRRQLRRPPFLRWGRPRRLHKNFNASDQFVHHAKVPQGAGTALPRRSWHPSKRRHGARRLVR